MRKFGSILAILSGLFTVVITIVAMLAIGGVITASWVKDYQANGTGSLNPMIFQGIVLGLGLLMVIFGFMSMGKSRGFASFILMGLFITSLVMMLIPAIGNHDWPWYTITKVSILSVASLGLVYGFINPPASE